MTRTEASPLPLAALVSAFLSLGVFLLAGGWPTGALPPGPGGHPAITQIPTSRLAFEPPAAGHDFVARGPGYTVATASDGWTIALRSKTRAALHTTLVGAAPGRPGHGGKRLQGRVNYIQGSDPSRWRTGVPTFGRVAYRGVYPGTDLVYHGNAGALEYDFQLEPYADPSRIQMHLSGARSLRVSPTGDLVASLRGGTVRQHRPVAYQTVGGARRHVDAHFVLSGNRVGFRLGDYDRSRALVIDPSLEFGDFIGGTSLDAAQKVALDSSGNIYVAGVSGSASIPGTIVRSKSTGNDAFVMKLSPSGARQWISFVGGNAEDRATDLALDGSGRPYITGFTDSTNFPGAGAKLGSLDGVRDAFIARLTTDGALSYGSYAGTDTTGDEAYGIAVEGTGAAYIADILTAYDGVTHQPTETVGNVVRFNASGTPDWYIVFNEADATIKNEATTAVGVPQGCQTNCDLFIAGRTTYTGAGGPYAIAVAYKYHTDPAPGNVQGLWGPSIFTTTMNPQDPQSPEVNGGETPTSLAVDSHGNPAIVGIKTVDQNTHYGFAARFNGATGAHDPLLVTWQTPGALNGVSNAFDIAFDAQDNAYFVGNTTASNDDTTDAVQGYKGSNDAFAVKLDPGGYPGQDHGTAHIVWGTYLGGGAHDYAYGVATDSSGGTYVVGETQSPEAIASPVSQPKSSGSDGFIMKIRTNSATITDGPSDTTPSRDVTFKYSSHETGGSFECRLAGAGSPMPTFSACGLLSQDFKGLPDGAYTFELKAFDSGKTSNGGITSRAFTVDNSVHARFSIAPNPALVGRAVTFDGSASNDAAHAIGKFEWDLDGDGSYETNSGGTPTVTQAYPSPGTFTIGLRVTDGEGRTATATNALQVNAATGPGTQFGVTINDGAQFTNKPDVTVTATFPSFTTGLLFSNDGGFGKAQTFAAKKDTPWTLDSSGPERLPKTIYVRFLTGSIASTSFQDDIILDETPPKVDQAVVTGPPGAAPASAAALLKFRVKMKATDKTSGVSKVQVTANKKKPGKALKYKKKFVVKAAKRPKWVRARDRAGNWSKWKKAR